MRIASFTLIVVLLGASALQAMESKAIRLSGEADTALSSIDPTLLNKAGLAALVQLFAQHRTEKALNAKDLIALSKIDLLALAKLYKAHTVIVEVVNEFPPRGKAEPKRFGVCPLTQDEFTPSKEAEPKRYDGIPC